MLLLILMLMVLGETKEFSTGTQSRRHSLLRY